MKEEKTHILKNFFKKKGLTQTAVAKIIGTSQQNINTLLTGKRPFSHATAKAFSDAFGLSTDWLINDEGPMLATDHHNHYTANNAEMDIIEIECPNCGEQIDVPGTAVIPLIPAEVAKAPDLNLESFRQNCPQEMKEVDLRQIWGNGVFLMRVDTRAMEPEYREGTFLVLKKLPDISFARADGSAYVVDTMRPHTLFRYLSKERDGSYTLTAENDRRGPIYLQADDILNVYDIVGSFRIGR
jgi:plasmid maintenance system antidote protein VapI